ncbi:hypothetical protein Tco_1003134 [Tanacetum coccineum]|uniref:Xylulose kinase-1 n=1 Tax=Tanacetum coccineum TaxID=301880 RepID=A0ABQ5F886_9ASTR
MAGHAFVNQHNMVTYLEKNGENAEFRQIVDFLSTCSINYALTVGPTIYASYIEQFWNTTTSKIVNSVKQIHATVDGKAVVISESSMRNYLLFDDEDGIACLINDDIFKNLALIGSKSTGWNEFSTNLASAVIGLAKGQNFNFSKLIFDGMLRNLDSKKFLIYPRQSKGFSGKATPLFDSMLVQNHALEGEDLGADEAVHREKVTVWKGISLHPPSVQDVDNEET